MRSGHDSVEQPVQASQNWQTGQSGLLASMLNNDPTLELLCGAERASCSAKQTSVESLSRPITRGPSGW